MNKRANPLALSMALPLALAAGAALADPPAPANLLVNGSFESTAITAYPWYLRSYSSLPGWTQFGDGVDIIHNNYTQPPPVLVDASDGVQFLDMNQARALGGISQTVGVTAGQTYRLSLDATAWATNAVGGTVGYSLVDPASHQVLASGSFTDPTGGSWVNRSLEATAISNNLQVVVQGLFATQAGMGVDNVRLISAVPEPGTTAMLASGLAALGWLTRRRRQA